MRCLRGVQGVDPGRRCARSYAAKRTGSSNDWIKRHVSDPYVKKATQLGYRSRAAFKLLEIDGKHRLLRPGMLALELGSAPGSWTQVLAAQQVRTIAMDCLHMEPVDTCRFLQGDFSCPEMQQALLREVLAHDTAGADLILSDISPNRSGHKILDEARLPAIIEQMLLIARQCLKPGGALVAKVIQGADAPKLVRAVRAFSEPSLFKPPASRSDSAEVYLVAKQFHPKRFDSSRWLREGLD